MATSEGASTPTTYRSLLLEGPRDVVEAALDELCAEASCLGAEELSGEADAVRLRLYFAPDAPAARLDGLLERLGRRFPSLAAAEAERVPERDWNAEWRSRFRGFALGRRFYVAPSWESAPTPPGRILLRIDPARAFGTGTHPTTRLLVDALEAGAARGRRVVDMGTGTGILAMVAARLGARAVLAVEPDPDALACARENLRRNGLEARVRLVHGAVESLAPSPAELVLANLNAPLLVRALPRLARWLRPGGRLLVSGLLAEDAAALEDASPPSLARVGVREREGWVALELERAR